MKRALVFAATLSTMLPMAALAVTVQRNLAITVTSAASQRGGNGDHAIRLLPADRDASANWRMAGLLSIGGIPNRNTQCGAAVKPLGRGQDDAADIQAAIQACSEGQVVQLSAGTFTIAEASYIWLNKGITLRGAGPGQTILEKPTGNPSPGLSSYPCPALPTQGQNFDCFQGGGGPYLILASPLPRFNWNKLNGCALTADTTPGSYSISVTSACASNFLVGDFVLLDELSGAQWMPDTESTPPGYAIWAAPDYRVVYNMHNPTIPYYDDGPGVKSNYTINSDRMNNEIKQIKSISGSTIAFDSPVMMSYRVSHSADLWNFSTPFLQEAGIEDMSLRYADNDAVQYYSCAYCWLRNTNIAYSGSDVVAVLASFRTQLEGNYIHECGWPVPGGGCYLIDQKFDTSESLIENNISMLGNKVIVMQSSGAGSVVAYNYFDKGYIAFNCCWQEIGVNASHLTGAHHILFEGNWTFNMDSDDTHGGSDFMTYFRNWSTAIRSTFQGINDPRTQTQGSAPTVYGTWNDSANNCGVTGIYGGGPLRAAAMQAHSYWMSFIGNMLGTPGCTTSANHFPLDNSDSGNGIFMLGWYTGMAAVNDRIGATIYPNTPPTVSCATGATCAMPSASCTTYGSNCATIVDGNFDTVDNTQKWASNDTAHTLPNSFYLASAPYFFSGYTWPWVDPSAGVTYTLPAKRRYDSQNCAAAVFQHNADCEPFD